MTKNLVIKKSHLLPWEEPEEYEVLFVSLLDEHSPQGPTEHHLVEELAGIIWRKQRIGMAEAALHRHGLSKTFASHSNTADHALAHTTASAENMSVSDAVITSPDKISCDVADVRKDQRMSERALELALDGKYATALKALRDDTREWWLETIEDGEDDKGFERAATAASLVGWLELVATPWMENSERRFLQTENIKNQAYGESLNPQRFNELGKWETHLDRKFERILAMLLKLQELRKNAVA